jgi:ribulose 1,5-bisphosphate synthetase/thiazole synthase
VHHVVRHRAHHLLPLALARQAVELGAEILPAVQLEDAVIGRRRAVEGAVVYRPTTRRVTRGA